MTTEKERKRIQVQKRKFQLEQERCIKPGECNKFLTAVIAENVTSEIWGSKIVEKLNSIDIETEITQSNVTNTIKWKRRINQKIISDTGEVTQFDDIMKDENYLIYILPADQFVKYSKENKLLSKIQEAQQSHHVTLKSTTLIVYGLKDFCRKRKGVIGIKETEIKLTQVQLFANCSHRLHETPDDVALTVAQFSKSIAEEPFKLKQNQKVDQEQLYLSSDNKVLARDDDSTSLARLWQTQLQSFPKVTYEVAQSITKEYPSPMSLIKAYEESLNPTAMLSDIPIIRTGPLSKTRRIGPELSRKIHTFFMSDNPEDIL